MALADGVRRRRRPAPQTTEVRSQFTAQSGPRKGLTATQIERDGRVFRDYGDVGGLGREIVELKLRDGNTQDPAGAKTPNMVSTRRTARGDVLLGQEQGGSGGRGPYREGVTASGRVVHQRGGKRLVLNAEQSRAAVARSPLLRKVYQRLGKGGTIR